MNPIRTILGIFLGFFIFFTPATISAEVFKSKSINSKSLSRYIVANELGTVSDVTLNGEEFSSFDDRTIQFYKDDLDIRKGIKLSGFLDSDSDIPVEQLAVEITTDGGNTWTKAQGHAEWDWSFKPRLGKEYDFGLRVVQVISDVTDTINIISPQDSTTISSLNDKINFVWNYPTDTATYKVVITDANGMHKHEYPSEGKQLDQSLIDMIRIDGNSLKWYVEAYDSNNALLTTSQERTLYLPDLDVEAKLNFIKNHIAYSEDISQDIIYISTSTEATLNGAVKNATDNSMVVDVVLSKETNNVSDNLFSQELIIPAKSYKPFAFDVLSKLSDDNTALKLSVSKSTQIATDSSSIDENFIVSKVDRNSYDIGDFTLITDAPPVDGKISGSGTITVDSLSKFDNCDGTLAVEFQNLTISGGAIVNGIVEYIPTADSMVMEPSKVSITANKIVFEPNDAYIVGKIKVKKIGKFVATAEIDVPHISLQSSGFTLDTTIDWRGESGEGAQEVPLWLGGFKLSLMLKTMDISVDSSESWYEMIKITDLSGGIKYGDIFSSTNTTIRLDTDGSIEWTLKSQTAINSNETFNFKDCSGKIDLFGEDPNVTIKGKIRAYYAAGTYADREHLDVDIGDGLTINSTGLQGEVGFDTATLSQGQDSKLGDISVKVKKFSILFDGGITGGGLTVGFDYDDFFNSGKQFAFNISAAISNEGISNFKIDGDNLTFSIDGFADFSFDNFTLKTELGNGEQTDNSFFMTDMTVTTISGDILKTSTDFVFEKLKLDSTGVLLGGASIWRGLADGSSVSASVYGVEVSIKKVGFGIRANENGTQGAVFIGFEGGGSIGGDIISVDNMKVALYADGTFDLLEAPEVNVDNSVVSFKGSLKNIQTTDIKGFEADGDLKVKNLGDGVHVNAQFMCGSFLDGEEESSSSYWRVAGYASTGVPIVLAPVPLNLYGFGGGVGYNVAYDTTAKKFVPQNNGDVVISLTTVIGTTDTGYTLHGPATLSFSTGGQITFDSTMYITSGLMQTPQDRKVDIVAQLTTSPFRFYASGDALVTKKASDNFNIMEVNGHVDLLFSSTNAHVHIGTKETPITANFLEVAENSGYLMFDAERMAFGYQISLQKRGSCCLMYGSIDVGAKIDTIVGIQPFYVDAEGKIWAIVSAGVEYKGFSYEVFNAGANIAARFRAPNPTYGKFDVELFYSILGGTVSGTYEMTYWINKPASGEEATIVNVGNLEVFKYALPMNGETEVSRFPKIEIATKLPLDKTMLLDSLLDEPTGTQYKFYIPKIREWTQNDPNMPVATNAEESILLFDLNSSTPNAVIENIFIGGKVGTGGTKLVFNVNRPLQAGHTYKTLFAGVIKDMSTEEIVGGEGYQQIFTVTKDSAVDFRSLVEEVHPHMGATGVYKQSDLYMRVRGVTIASLKVKLYDPLNREFGDTWRFKQNTLDNSEATQLYAYIAENHPDLKPIVVYECDQTGEQKEAVMYNGREYNPFIYTNLPTEYDDTQSTTYNPTTTADETGIHIASTPELSQTQVTYAPKNIYEAQQPRYKGKGNISIEDVTTEEDVYKDVYTYTKKVLTTYTIKATYKTQEGEVKNIYNSTFDVAVPQYTVTTDKAGNETISYPDYADEIEMLHETMKDAKFKIVRAPIDYDKKQEEWDFYIHSSYEPSIEACHNYNIELAMNMGYYNGYASTYEENVQTCEAPVKQRLAHYSEILDKKYAHGGLSYLLFEFGYHGFIDPKNISINATPTCRVGSDYNTLFVINDEMKSFSNYDAQGNAAGENGYQVLRAMHNKMQIKLNLNIYPNLRDRLSNLVSQKADFDNITCGFVNINPRNLSVSGFNSSITEETQTSNGYDGIFKNNLPLTE